MHIAIRLGRQKSGGMAAFVRELSDALRGLPGKHRVSYAYVGEAWKELEGPSKSFGAMSTLDEYRVDMVRIGRWCEEEGVDLLLCPGNQAARTNGKTVWWPLTVAPYEHIALDQLSTSVRSDARWWLVKRSLDLSARTSDCLVFSSNYARALYEAGLGADIKSKPSTVIHPSTSIEIRASAPTKPPYLLSVSNFNRYKFALEIVDGFSRSEPLRLGWRLRLIGRFPDGDYERDVRESIERLGLSDRVDLVGELTPGDLASEYENASGFVFLSVSENAASYTVIDALAYGLPVVSSFYSSTPEIVGNAAVYVDPFSPSSISDGLDLFARSDETTQLKELALEQALKFPSWVDIAGSLVEFAARELPRRLR